MVARTVNLIMRGLQFLWSLLIMALVGNMIASAFHNNPSSVNYDMFISVFGMLTLFYLIPATWNEGFAHPLIMLVLDGLNVIFWLTGAIATAALLGAHSCSNSSYTHRNHITNGSRNTEKRCREAQASTAFLWFGWAAFTVSLVISFMNTRSGGVSVRVPHRRGPNMSQV